MSRCGRLNHVHCTDMQTRGKGSGNMLNTEGQWSETLADNNIRAIIRWLKKLTAEGEADVEDILPTFSRWVQRTSEFAKKELLTLCFSRCHGLWMFLDRSSFTRVHMLLQRLRNLLTLAQWARRHLCSVHLWHGVGVPCEICRDTCDSSDICWNKEHRALKQHIWLGRLVQWWGITGLLPKLRDAQEVKRISQMWKEMEQSHKSGGLDTPRSLIQGMVTQLDRQHGCIWTSEDGTDRCYPPPNLQALLKLVLKPHIDNMSVQAILMYFTQDVANFLQCKDDLLRSFCHAFTIPPSFSQQVRAFWMFDHGHIKASMDLLLSPGAAAPWLSWQHHCIIRCLLVKKQPRVALKYLQWTRPAIETPEDARLYSDALLQSSCVSDAWAILKSGNKRYEDVVMHSVQGKENCSEIETTEVPLAKKDIPPCPLSATLYQAQRVSAVTSEELVKMVRKAQMDLREPRSLKSEVVWPEHTEKKSNSREIFLSTQALGHLTPSPSPVDLAYEPGDERPAIHEQPEAQDHICSSEGPSSESASSFTSASSLPLLKRDRPRVYESTLTLQRMSSLLTDGENGEEEEEEEEEDEASGTSSSTGALPDCPELILTPDGATDPVSLSGWNKDNFLELMLCAKGREEDAFPHEDIFSPETLLGAFADENLLLDTSFKFDLQCQFYSNDDSQSVPDFLSPDYEKNGSCKGVSQDIVHEPPDVVPLRRSSGSVSKEDQSDGIPSYVLSSREQVATVPDCFLEQEFHQEQEEPLEGSSFSSCIPSKITEQRSFVLEVPIPGGSPGMSEQDGSLTSPDTDTSLKHSPTSDIKTTSAPSDATSDGSSKSQSGTSAWPEFGEVGGWCKQAAGTCRTLSDLSSAAEPGAAIMPREELDNRRPPSVLNQPYTYFTTKGDNRDFRQARTEEPTCWSSLGKAPQGAMRSGRTRSHRGKRGKRM
ncbi:uncharacterized protein LOC125023864 isoform X2 [Mugil cephalus]|uniref:uncharacterized protein LOC125023864 isoform X2 n=1 Tax=Mugil cephalus TaxID=48193 RepID=UPI001FB7B812|nr:uncharacterized protein LOC125023864 isoform X2 [Mugil cephalus]